MLVHNVYFWLKGDLTADGHAAFLRGLESLRAIDTVRELYVGKPAPTPDRPVVDRTFDYALTVILGDVNGHDVYQEHEIHRAFVERFSTFWERVQIYDAA